MTSHYTGPRQCASVHAEKGEKCMLQCLTFVFSPSVTHLHR